MMLYFRSILFSILLSFFCTLGLSAQTQVNGLVIDNSGVPLTYANIMLFSAVDSAFVKGEVAGEDGRFEFSGLKPGSFYCQVSMVGLSAKVTPAFEVNDQIGSLDLGTIVLSESQDLEEVVVTANKAMIEVRADKLVFNVANSPAASGTNGLDLLAKAPGVTVDMDNNIQLLGKTGVQIYINGKPSRLSGQDLAMMLQNMNSDNIESVEIISNPSSKYEAEGNAGIININLKRNVALGLNGNLTSSFSQGIHSRFSNSLSMNYGGGKVNAYLAISRADQDIQDDFIDIKRQNNNALYLDSDEIKSSTSYNFSGGMDIALSKAHNIGFSGNAILNQSNDHLISTTGISYPPNSEVDEVLLSQTILDQPSKNYNLNANYSWAIDEHSNFSSSISWGKFQKKGNTYQPNTFFEKDQSTEISTSNNAFDTDTDIDLFSSKLDYEKAWNKLTFSTGAKFSYISTDNRFDFFRVEELERIPDLSRSNDFTYLEKVLSAYAILDAGLGKFTNLSAGLRVENTTSRGKLISAFDVDNADVRRSYTDLFPNIGLSYDDKKTNAISISVGRRISRPNYQNLNPFESPLSELTAWKGNPFLNPSYTMNYQAVYAFMQKLTITGQFSETKGFVATLFEISGENSNIIIPRNISNTSSYGISASYPLEVNKYWEFVTFVNARRLAYNSNLGGGDISLRAITWNFRIQNNLKLPWGLFMDVTFMRYSDWIWRGSVRVEGNHYLDLGIRKDFFDKRLQIRLTGSDVLRSNSDYFYNGNYGGILLDGLRTFDHQRFGAGITWNFGNQKVKRVKKSKGAMDDELDRLGGSD